MPEGIGSATGWRCLWLVGWLTNGAALASQCGLPASARLETLLETAFARFGTAALREMHGPIACVLWDAGGERLIAARDRLGCQPLVFAEKGPWIALGRIAPELLHGLGLSAEPHRPSLVDFLIAGRPAPGATFHHAVHALDPGEFLEVSSRRAVRRTWWHLTEKPLIPERCARESLVTTLDQVVGEHLVGRRPALTLSGGMDSAAVAAAMRRAMPEEEVVAITWTTPSLPDADESVAAAETARQLGLRSIELAIDDLWPLSSPEGFATRPETPFRSPYREVWDATFRHVAGLGIYDLATGAGGDQLFGYCGPGIYAYPDLLLGGRWWNLQRQLRQHRAVSTASLLRILDRDLVRPLLRPLVRGLTPARRRVPEAAWLSEDVRRQLHARLKPAPAPRQMLPGRRFRYRVLTDPFPSVVLQAVGELGAQAGVTPWSPLVDHRMWELAARLPSTASFRAGYYKALLREGLQERLPRSCIDRRIKTHAAPLYNRGLRERETAKVWPLLEDMRAADMGLVNEAALRKAYSAYLAGDSDSRFWFALCVEDWLRRHF